MSRSHVLNGLLLVGCLALAGFVLRASLPAGVWHAHPATTPDGRPAYDIPTSGEGQFVNPKTWRPATSQERRAAVICIRGQLLAFRADDYDRAFAYQGIAMKSRDSSPAGLRALITQDYPEFAQFQSAQFGEAQADPDGRHVDVAVTVTGLNGAQSHALYMMVREGAMYRVGSVTDIHRGSVKSRP